MSSDEKDKMLEREAELIALCVQLHSVLSIWTAGKCPANIWKLTHAAYAAYEKAGLK